MNERGRAVEDWRHHGYSPRNQRHDSAVGQAALHEEKTIRVSRMGKQLKSGLTLCYYRQCEVVPFTRLSRQDKSTRQNVRVKLS